MSQRKKSLLSGVYAKGVHLKNVLTHRRRRQTHQRKNRTYLPKQKYKRDLDTLTPLARNAVLARKAGLGDNYQEIGVYESFAPGDVKLAKRSRQGGKKPRKRRKLQKKSTTSTNSTAYTELSTGAPNISHQSSQQNPQIDSETYFTLSRVENLLAHVIDRPQKFSALVPELFRVAKEDTILMMRLSVLNDLNSMISSFVQKMKSYKGKNETFLSVVCTKLAFISLTAKFDKTLPKTDTKLKNVTILLSRKIRKDEWEDITGVKIPSRFWPRRKYNSEINSLWIHFHVRENQHLTEMICQFRHRVLDKDGNEVKKNNVSEKEMKKVQLQVAAKMKERLHKRRIVIFKNENTQKVFYYDVSAKISMNEKPTSGYFLSKEEALKLKLSIPAHFTLTDEAEQYIQNIIVVDDKKKEKKKQVLVNRYF